MIAAGPLAQASAEGQAPRITEIPYYLATDHEEQVFRTAFQNRLPMMLKGPTGCGKTRFVEYMAAKLGRPLITVSCNEDTTATDLLGRHLFKGGDTEWYDGPLTRGVRESAIVYLDEIAEARADAMVAIHPLTDYRRELFLDRTGETLKAQPDFMLVVSYNPGYQKSLRELKPSTRQRFVGLSFGYPDEDQEAAIVVRESQIEMKVAQKLVRIGRKIRALKELSLMESASTRLLIAAGLLMRGGLPPRLACFTAIAEPLTDDIDARAALKQLIDISI
ncbi:MAG: ATPase family protein associated with various cellular [Fibrobacteres bacterium]|nr:ATPase family protein associated with various cellular [Fibrobacterota bacterium]